MFTGVEVAVSVVDHLHSVPDALCYEMGRETQLYQQAHVAVSKLVEAENEAILMEVENGT